ncbi:hypothetical protein AB4Y42_06075 [Paraburkholderia sp. EG286B]|uniref:hypothetical protein n=1 Tax=Paraburkholderia sp. EG286B TaxID=3237011 RepID=UPI0034D1D86B
MTQTPEDIRADQLAYGKEQSQAARERRDAFRSPLYHALKGAKLEPRRFSDLAQFHEDES